MLAEGPAIIYNVPGRTGQDIPDDVILGIAQHENFLGVKECTGALRRSAVRGCAVTRVGHVGRMVYSGPDLPANLHTPTPGAGNSRIEAYHGKGVLCWSGNDDEAHAARHQHHSQVRSVGS